MIQNLELSQLELNLISALMGARQKAQNEEFEFVQLLFKAKGVEFPKTNVELKEGKLVWVDESVIVPEIVAG